MLSDELHVRCGDEQGRSLNAPFGARCFLTDHRGDAVRRYAWPRLNAPFGARCFLTQGRPIQEAARREES